MKVSFPQDLPSEKWRQLINEYAGILPDPALRLKFTRDVLTCLHRIPKIFRFYPPFGEIAFREILSEEIEKLLPGSRSMVNKSIQRGEISRPPFTLRNIYRFRRPILLIVIAGLIGGLGIGAASLNDFINPKDDSGPINVSLPQPEQPVPVGGYFRGIAPVRKLIVPSAQKEDEEGNFPRYIENPIWLVEKIGDVETYSNGLQIITSFCVENIQRSYLVFPKGADKLPGQETLRTEIRGILYHASEGDMVPFKPEKNRLIKKYSSQLLTYVCRKKGYHYLIDRFGRVYQIVREEDAAFHAGNSVWADESSIFLNLNHAFLGVCFEGKGFEEVSDSSGKTPRITAMDASTITVAQVKSGKELTDWLRFKYGIPQQNCVPHGMASIYPKNRLVGYHLDLAYGFPFHRFGLRNKYNEMIPSIIEFGFTCDRYFHKVLKGNVWPGIRLSEDYLKNKAKLAGESTKVYKKKLNRRFERNFEWQGRLQEKLSKAREKDVYP
jgi:hypothetical protein